MAVKKNPYSICFFNYEKQVLKLQYVHKIDTALKWVRAKKINFTHANIYDRKTGIFLERHYEIDKKELIIKLFERQKK